MKAESNNRSRWTVRRRMAKTAFIAAIIETLVLITAGSFGLLKADIIQALGVVIISSYTFFGGIITIYISAATYDDVKSGGIK